MLTTPTRATLRFDRPTRRVQLGTVRAVLPQRAFDLLELLAVAVVLAAPEDVEPWVTVQQIGSLPSWCGSRSAKSLRSQIRREIKNLRDKGLDVVATMPRHLTTGPFRLKVEVDETGLRVDKSRPLLATVRGQLRDPGQFAQWLESVKSIWQSFYRFDKPNQDLFEGLEGVPAKTTDPVLDSMALLNVARRAREVGETDKALDATSEAMTTATAETNPYYQSALIASCHLHTGWAHYREESYADARRCVAAGLETLEQTGHGHLRVRGQLLILRSLLSRREGRLNDALRELWTGAECSLIELDLMNSVGVYHNLSVLLEEMALAAKDVTIRRHFLDLAVDCAKKNLHYCTIYKVGGNSVLNRIHLARLYEINEDLPSAVLEADKAFLEATDIGNRIDAARSHCQRVRLRLMSGRRSEAAALQKNFAATCDPETKRRVTEYYRQSKKRRFPSLGVP